MTRPTPIRPILTRPILAGLILAGPILARLILARPLSIQRAAAVALALLFCLAGARAGHAADAGQVLTFNGNCFIVAGDQRTALKMGDTVHTGDVIEVPIGARLKLRMVDGSVVSLASGSRMTIKNYDVSADGTKRDARLQLDTGLIRAVVAKATQPSNFEIDTATGVAAARSTDWFVETAPEKTEVTVLDGTVGFSRAGAGAQPETVMIPAHSGSEILGQAAPAPVKPVAKAVFDKLIDRTSIIYGICQCIDDRTGIRLACLTGPDACKARCAGGNYSFVPDARRSCRRAAEETVLPDKRN